MFDTLARLGYQIIFGAGAGIGLELPNIAVQTVLPEADVATGTSLVVFARSLGGAIFIAAGQQVFNNRIIAGLAAELPDLDPAIVLNLGATDLRSTVITSNGSTSGGGEDVMPQVLAVYNEAIVRTFVVVLAMACVSVVGTVGVEWRSIKGQKKQSPA